MLSHSETFVDEVHQHLCSKGLFGDVAHWCEMRNDCVWVVTCPDCGETFALEEEEYDLLIRRSHDTGDSCGITPLEAD
jgi:hypothetical protein